MWIVLRSTVIKQVKDHRVENMKRLFPQGFQNNLHILLDDMHHEAENHMVWHCKNVNLCVNLIKVEIISS